MSEVAAISLEQHAYSAADDGLPEACSGTGRELGREGIEAYLETKTVIVKL